MTQQPPAKVIPMTDAPKAEAKPNPIIIKKYANRRLYNTETSSYVTLEHLSELIKEGKEFVVYDAKSGEDLTRPVLTQIIVEQESKGQSLLPTSVLRTLIGMYGDNMQWLVPQYLEHSLQAFARNQDQMRGYFQNAFGGMFPFPALEEMGKKNMAMFEQAMKMFSPFAAQGEGEGKPGESKGGEGEIETLRRKLDELQTQFDALNKKK